MNKECDTIRDLMPLVLDDVASENSKNMVTRHVEDCKECREYMDQLIADLPAATAEEVRQEQKANQEAARMLRRKKRTRNLKLLLLGILIASVVFCIGLFAWHRMVNLTKPVPLENYHLNFIQLQDGSVYVTADLNDYKKTEVICSEQYKDRSLYLFVQTRPYTSDSIYPMQKGLFGEICIDDYDAIYQGTPTDCQLVWEKGQQLPSASAWFEIYHFWQVVSDRMAESKTVEANDGKLLFESEMDDDQRRWNLISVQINYYHIRVPEFAPISTMRFLTQYNPADEATIRWILEGVPGIEEKDILRLFELMNQVQDEMNNSPI